MDMNFAKLNVPMFAGSFVFLVHGRKSLFKLQGNTLPHDTLCVDSINQSVNL